MEEYPKTNLISSCLFVLMLWSLCSGKGGGTVLFPRTHAQSCFPWRCQATSQPYPPGLRRSQCRFVCVFFFFQSQLNCLSSGSLKTGEMILICRFQFKKIVTTRLCQADDRQTLWHVDMTLITGMLTIKWKWKFEVKAIIHFILNKSTIIPKDWTVSVQRWLAELFQR